MKERVRNEEKVWTEFSELCSPTPQQLDMFRRYADYLLERNESFNLTALTDVSSVVRYHFMDSIALRNFVDLSAVSSIADIGTGAGFPAIPLKIMFPHLKVVLIEVTHKKQEFLQEVIRILGLTDIEVCGHDWRTFLRTTHFNVDYFVTRAALDDLELSRMFKPACVYNKAQLVYWVSKEWEVHAKMAPHLKKLEHYRVGNKDRRLAFFSRDVQAETAAKE